MFPGTIQRLVYLSILVTGIVFTQEAPVTAEAKASRVMVIPLSDEGRFMVDQVQAEFIIKALDRAEDENFQRVILKIDTYGGVVISAREITERLLRLSIPTTAFVETKAISAGVFIAFACDDIVMRPMTTIGDAQMIMQTMEGGIEEAPEKMVSVYRSDWKKSCDAKDRSFALAQGFFDVKVEVLQVGDESRGDFMLRDEYDALAEGERPSIVKVLSKEGHLLTLHAEEAERIGLVRIQQDLETYLASLDITPSQVEDMEMNWREMVLRFLGANPWIFMLLTLVGLSGLYMEIKAPGFGISGLTALVCFAIVFGSRYLLGTASELEIALFVLGVVLALLEIFVLPGFGVFGISALIMIFASLILASLPDFGGIPQYDFHWEWITQLAFSVGAAFFLSLVLSVVLLPNLLRIPMAQRHLLQTEFRQEAGYIMDTVTDRDEIKGAEGVTTGDLRPAGKMRLDNGRLLDVVSDGSYVPADTRVRIHRVEGNRIIVRPVTSKA